jgi:hypothetical protein
MGSDGFGARGGTGDGPSVHRPAVTFGARRASLPARRPAVARGVRRPRSVSATSRRLDGLLGGCDARSRKAIPGSAPHGIVPIETRTPAAQYRVLHARRYATSQCSVELAPAAAAGSAAATGPAPLACVATPSTTSLGGVGFQPAQRPLAFGAAAPRRAGCPLRHGLRLRCLSLRSGAEHHPFQTRSSIRTTIS